MTSSRGRCHSLMVAFPQSRSALRFQYAPEDSSSTFVCCRSYSNCPCRGHSCSLRRACLRRVYSSGERHPFVKVVHSRGQIPIPPLHNAVSYILTALLSRLALLILGVWWIPVEQVSRKRGCVSTLSFHNKNWMLNPE